MVKNFKYIIRKAKQSDLQQIELLQKKNLGKNLNKKEKEEQGFVSVETDVPLLANINKDIGILVTEIGGKVVGYEMPLSKEYAVKIPLLNPFIERFLELKYRDKKLKDYKWVIEGQICIDKEHKGKGIAENLHKKFVNMLKGRYSIIVTEISDQNPRSLKVHIEKLGLKIIDKYKAEGRNWFVLIQDIR